MPNGNTFVALSGEFMYEVDAEDNVVWQYNAGPPKAFRYLCADPGIQVLLGEDACGLTTDVEETASSRTELFPNPTVGIINLRGIDVEDMEQFVIRDATGRVLRRATYDGLGREIVQKMLAKLGKPYVDKEVSTSIARVGHKNVDDALAAIGRGELSAIDMLKAMGHTIDDTKLKELRRKTPAKKTDPALSVPVRGVSRTTALKISPETGAVPGERIVGILTPGEGITIYPIFAKALEQFDNQPERWVDLAWDTGAEEQRFPARLTVTILNEVGSLAQVTQSISDLGGNIDALMMVAREGARDFYDADITLEVHDLKHLNEIMASLRGKPAVSDVSRKTG